MSERRSLLQESLAAIERLQARLDERERAEHAPIAIVGAGCRYPGDIENPESLWRVVRDAVDAVREVPADRWDANAYYDPDPKAPGKMVTKRGGFLSQVDRFDPQFFGISPREAATMDPQQRLLLECACEALESAGLATDRLAGSATGVFVGITTSDYGQLLRLGGPEHSDVYSATGSALNAAAGRVAFTFGFQGPCVAVDTACSSSLVAVHLACQSLRTGESDLALAGGVNVILSPDAMVLFSKWGMMAPDGACKTFDAAADGFVRAEGCAVIALKRLSDAQAAGDPILAVIRGSAVNSDGRSSGLTVPNGPAQQAVLRKALLSAELNAADIDYVEAHGTGTSLGDPIEVEALGAVMREGRSPQHPLLIGSIKTNIGHAEASSGLAGLLKVVMSLRHEAIPPHLHFSRPNPGIPWADLRVEVPTALTPWPRGERPRRAGVSSFGFSGTNAHVILEEAPAILAPAATFHAPMLVPLAARDDAALRALARRLADFLAAHPEVPVADVATTTSTGRAHPLRRLAVVADSTTDLARDLGVFAAGETPVSAVEGSTRPGERPKIAFLFTGQGAQYAGMGRGLYDTEPVFRAAIDRAAGALAPVLERPLLEVLFPAGGTATPLGETAYTQPALFALEFALAELWRSWGIIPSVVLGHSVGEYAAACVAGVFSFEDGLALIAERGRLMQALPPGGAMAAVFATESAVAPHLARLAGRVTIAAVNGPEETVISGDSAAIDRVLEELTAAGVKSKRLDVSHAFHSPLLDPMLDALERRARAVTCGVPQVPLVSNLTGQLFAPGAKPDASYWRRHAREPVRFAACIDALRTVGVTALLEIGPHPTLLALAGRAEPGASWSSVPSLRRERDDRREMLSALGTLYTRGATVNWEAVRGSQGVRRGDLPTYPFQRERFWIANAPSRARDEETTGHPLLGQRRELASAPGTHLWQRNISLESHPWLADHRVQGAAIVPATAYIEMALAASGEILGREGLSVREIENLKPILLHDGVTRELQTTLTVERDGTARFSAHSRLAGAPRAARWTTHVTARVFPLEATFPVGEGLSVLEGARARCTRELEGAAFYAALAAKGNQWGPAFQGMERVWIGDGEAIGRVRAVHGVAEDTARYRFHPALSDSCGHVLVATIPTETSRTTTGGAFVGGGVGEVRFHEAPVGATLWVHATLRPEAGGERRVVHGDVQVYDDRGALITETLDARLWYLDDATGSEFLGAPSEWFYDVRWEARAIEAAGERASGSGAWIVIADRRGVGAAFAAERQGTLLVEAGGGTDYARVLADAGPRAAVVYLGGLDAPAGDGADDAVVCARDSRADDLVRLVRCIVESPLRPRPRLWIASCDAQPVVTGDRVSAPWGAALWGLGRALSVEHSEIWGGLVDLDPDAPPSVLAPLLSREIAQADGEDKIAFRRGQRFVARLSPRSLAATGGEVRPRPDATYVVTGGLGGIGLAMAQWLAANGARHLLLVARTPLPPRDSWSRLDVASAAGRRVAAVTELEARGVRVETAAIDVAHATPLRACVDARRARGEPPIRGVVHAAGVLHFKAIEELDSAGLSDLVAGKADGAWHLHHVLQNEPLDMFVLCSSSSTLFSSPLLGGYAAANSFLDALAHYRHARGLAALSVDWGTWGEVGMAVEGGRSMSGDMLRGMGTIPTARGLAALQALIDDGATQAAVLPVNWAEIANSYAAMAADPFLSDLVGDFAATTDAGGRASFSLEAFRAAAPADQSALVGDYLRREAARVLGLAADRLDPAIPLSSLGFDSLMAVQLKNRIETDLAVVVPMVQFLQGPSVDQLRALAVDAVRLHGAAAVASASPTAAFEEGSL